MKSIVDYINESTTEILNKSKGFNLRKLLDQKDFKNQTPIALSNESTKTPELKKLASMSNMEAVVVYLDKAEEGSDITGIPVVDKNGNVQNAVPEWTKKILDNPDKRFMVIFDEIEKVKPKVMNAMMPMLQYGLADNALIILHGCNNIEDLKDSLSKPLQSRIHFVA